MRVLNKKDYLCGWTFRYKESGQQYLKSYNIMEQLLKDIQALLETFSAEAEAQLLKGNKAAGARARKASLEAEKLLKEFRKASVEASK